MFDQKKIIAVIPARSGSKGIKDKNIYPLCGKPLIAYSIEHAKKCKYIDEVLVSTDSEKIANISEKYGAYVPFLRPDKFADDRAKTIDAVLHAVNWLNANDKIYDVLVLLQPTSPLRTGEDINCAVETYFKMGMISLASVSEVTDHPVLIRSIKDGKMVSLLKQESTIRRQDMEMFYKINGSIYINRINELNSDTSFNDNEIPYIMPHSHSVDIDTETDIRLAELYMRNVI